MHKKKNSLACLTKGSPSNVGQTVDCLALTNNDILLVYSYRLRCSTCSAQGVYSQTTCKCVKFYVTIRVPWLQEYHTEFAL